MHTLVNSWSRARNSPCRHFPSWEQKSSKSMFIIQGILCQKNKVLPQSWNALFLWPYNNLTPAFLILPVQPSKIPRNFKGSSAAKESRIRPSAQEHGCFVLWVHFFLLSWATEVNQTKWDLVSSQSQATTWVWAAPCSCHPHGEADKASGGGKQGKAELHTLGTAGKWFASLHLAQLQSVCSGAASVELLFLGWIPPRWERGAEKAFSQKSHQFALTQHARLFQPNPTYPFSFYIFLNRSGRFLGFVFF